MPAVTTPADVLAEAARQLRDHYGARLEELYALPRSPYEPDEDAHIHLVLVLEEPVDAYDEADPLSRIIDALNRQYAGAHVLFQHIADGSLAELARREGVRL
jgi:RecB family exonuclease